MRLQKRLALIGILFLAVFTAGTVAFMLVEGSPAVGKTLGELDLANRGFRI